MSQGNHTPGPWEVDAYGDVTANGEDVARVVGGYGIDECKANACLIAAAPRLLAALEALAETYVRDADVYDPRTEPALIEARAAIQQATGEA